MQQEQVHQLREWSESELREVRAHNKSYETSNDASLAKTNNEVLDNLNYLKRVDKDLSVFKNYLDEQKEDEVAMLFGFGPEATVSDNL